MASITQDYSEALGKQVFAKEYILNGLFPCQSDIVKMFELARVDWKFNDKFEYRMLFSNTNSGNTVNTQTFNSNFKLLHPGQLEYGVFQASYGALMDGFNIDMTKQLETRESRAAFNKEYSTRLHSMRLNVAALFKNLSINGRYGVLWQVMPPLTDTINADGSPNYDVSDTKVRVRYTPRWYNPSTKNFELMKIITASTGEPGLGFYIKSDNQSIKQGDRFQFDTPSNVYHSNFKNGRLLGRAFMEREIDLSSGHPGSVATVASGRFAPWGVSYIDDCWVVYDNQPKYLELVYIGPNTPNPPPIIGTGSNKFNPVTSDTGALAGVIPWGCYFELFGNRKAPKAQFEARKLQNPGPNANTPGWDQYNDMYDKAMMDFETGYSDVLNWKWGIPGSDKVTPDPNGWNGQQFSEATGGMEGLADLFPWYAPIGSVDYGGQRNRLGTDRFFRGQRNRLKYTAEQAGMFYRQRANQSIMDCLLEAVEMAKGTVPWEDMVIWINPTTLTAVGMYEQMMGNGPRSAGLVNIKETQLDSKLIYQRGITAISFRIGNQIIPNIVTDYNLPTDIILIAPLKDIAYNCWDNAAFQMNQYIQETFAKKKPPAIKDLTVPREFTTKLDLSARIVYGAPVSGDLSMMNPDANGNQFGYNGFIHPSNSLPVAYYEMGSLFTPNPYAYTVVKLANQIINPSDTCEDLWDYRVDSRIGLNVRTF